MYNNRKITAIVQVRTGSSRVPNKVLKVIEGKPIITHVIDRIRLSKYIDDIIIATTDLRRDNIIEEYCRNNNIKYFRGSEQDVLSRFYYTAKSYNVDIIARLTSENPLLDPDIIDIVIKKHIDDNNDYTANNIKRTYPRGLDTEIFNFNILEKVFNNATKDYEKEHVTPYIYDHPNKFKLSNIEAVGKFNRPDIRITLDTYDDLKLLEVLLHHFKDKEFRIEDIIDFLNENPKLLDFNKDIVFSNTYTERGKKNE